mmetsp:Transcript_11202/g.15408  ORF Transcript_11202/g.15408 Transcript_11202/m.15408 type:complete len:247 (+) Transcript_11202:268-1008(+)
MIGGCYFLLIFVQVSSSHPGSTPIDSVRKESCCNFLKENGTVYTKQGHGRSGPSDEISSDCKCEPSNEGDSRRKNFVYIVSGLAIMFIVLLSTSVLLKRHNQQRHSLDTRQDTSPATDNVDLRNKEIEAQVRLAKHSLVVKNVVDQATCVCCLEAFSETDCCVVPPNCDHIFHQHCILQWLDTALNSTTKEVRALQCPTCASSMLPQEGEVPSSEYLRIPILEENESAPVSIDHADSPRSNAAIVA